MTMWMAGDPCPHCGVAGEIKFNGGDPKCISCGQHVDDEHTPRVYDATRKEGTLILGRAHGRRE